MPVSVHLIDDRKGKHVLFSLSDKEVFLLSEECLYPLFGCRIDDYGKTFLYPCHILAIQDFLTQRIIDKEKAYCYDRDYATLISLWERFANFSSDTSLFLLGD